MDFIDKYFDQLREVLQKSQNEVKIFLQRETQKQIDGLEEEKNQSLIKLQNIEEFI